MKIRAGFVSNSSSSSFIVIGKSNEMVSPGIVKRDMGCFGKNTLVVDGQHGETEFGWGPNVIYDVPSRINFAYMQTIYAGREEWLAMLEDVICKYLDVERVDWKITTDWCSGDEGLFGYIDHQSSAVDGQNTEMFESEEALKAFLFNESSKIVLDNDNH